MSSYRCAGRKDKNAPCKSSVLIDGDYCRYHLDQKPYVTLCECYLNSGSTCPYPAQSNGFCEYHIEPTQCQGTTILGDICLRAITSGKYCHNCKRQADIVEDSVKSSAEKMREYIIKDRGPIITSKKALSVFMGTSINLKIPKGLQKIEIPKPEDCCICLEPMNEYYETTYRKLNCGHYFHLDCISKITKMTCPVCRANILKPFLPKWVFLRIEENVKRYDLEQLEEQRVATRRFVQTLIGEDILEMNSSEEDDFHHHVNNGADMGITAITDEAGNARLAVVVLGTTPT